MSSTSTSAWCYDFMVNGLAYKKTGTNTVAVTSVNFSNNYPQLTVADVPSSVSNGGVSYSVESIDDFAFYECPKLSAASIPNSVTSIGTYAFYGCSSLTSVNMASGVSSIGTYAFASTALNSVVIPGSVFIVGDYAYYDCTSMKYLTIGSNVSNLGQSAFGNCNSLIKITCNNPNPIAISASVFDGVDYSSCLLLVPTDSKDNYSEAPVWKNFANIIEMSSTGSDDEPTGENVLYAQTQTYIRGTKSQIVPVELINETTVSAIQFDMYMPSNVSFYMNNGQCEMWLDENRKSRDHTISYNNASNYTTVVISSPSSKPLKLNSGNLFYFKIASSVPSAGDYEINIENIICSTPDAQRFTLPDCKIKVKLRYWRGDANGDGEVDVADYVLVCNDILHRNPSPFYSDAANYNDDVSIDVADLVNITNVAIGRTAKTIGGGY